MGYIGQPPANKVVKTADIEDNAVTSAKIDTDTIAAADLAPNSVDSSELVDGSIDTSHIGALQVTGAKLNTDVISAQTALGATPADTDELLVSDAGVLKRVDYSYLKGITAANFRPNGLPIMINGDMSVAQRSASVASISSGGLAYSTVDRIGYWIGTAGTWTQTQETLTSGNAWADGFTKALKWDNTTANGSLSAGSYLMTSLPFEGNSLQAFKKGTSNAEVLTLAFWVKATKTGTNIIELYDSDNTRQISQAYTIDSTNTWEKKVMTFAADTSADPWGNDNGRSLEIYFWWVAGTNYTSGSLNTSWTDGAANNTRTVGQVNNADSTSNNIHLTGVQIEVGTYTSSTIPPFQHESYGDNKRRCQRYYETSFIDGQIPGTSVSGGNSGLNTSWADGNCPLPGGGKFKVSKRATPTVVLYARGSTTTGQLTSSGTARTAVATQIGTEGVEYCAITSGTAAAYSGGSWTASAEL
ncbi:putative carbohydrate binding domain containing protein [uncultured Mediterranean phage]|nr:putative carbohydrate binding domain containing protein [uncultured Mediterranean phage]